jgi:hypothetical protein
MSSLSGARYAPESTRSYTLFIPTLRVTDLTGNDGRRRQAVGEQDPVSGQGGHFVVGDRGKLFQGVATVCRIEIGFAAACAFAGAGA